MGVCVNEASIRTSAFFKGNCSIGYKQQNSTKCQRLLWGQLVIKMKQTNNWTKFELNGKHLQTTRTFGCVVSVDDALRYAICKNQAPHHYSLISQTKCFINRKFEQIQNSFLAQKLTYVNLLKFKFRKLISHAWTYTQGLKTLKCFTRPAVVAMLFRRPMQRLQQSILSHSLTGVWLDKLLNKFGRYVKKWNVHVWRLNMFTYWTCSLSLQLTLCLTLASC